MGYASCTEATKLMKAFLIVVGALISIAASEKDSGLANMPTNPAATSGWSIRYSPGMPASMSQNADGTYYVDLPHQDGLHYVVQGAQGNLTGKTKALVVAQDTAQSAGRSFRRRVSGELHASLRKEGQ
jgi:hypothetical protein